MSFGSVWITLPNTTWPTSSPATSARDRASRTTCAPSSVGATSFNPPPKSPIAVRTPETTTTSRCTGISALPHYRIAQRADAGDLDLANIAMLHVCGRALSAHPQHIARIQRKIARHRHQEVDHPEHHVVGLEGNHLLAVQPDLCDQALQIHIGLNP